MKKKDYVLRNDLAIQNKKYKKINSYELNDIRVQEYRYDSFSFTDILFKNVETNKNKNDVKRVLKKEIKRFLKKYKLNSKASTLVVGLGNKNIISDALGAMTCENVISTGYFSMFNNYNYRYVYKFVPGTIMDSGIMAFKGIKALAKEISPTFIIIIDSLVCSHIRYLNSVIQISDRGITPGSGFANYQEEISFDTIGIPVLVIGVPTATYASTIIRDALNIKENHISFKEGYDFVVASKDIDLIIKSLSKIIGESINEALNNLKKF